MDTRSVAYVLCRIEDDSSLTPVSEHGDFLSGIAAACERCLGSGRVVVYLYPNLKRRPR